MATRFYLDSRKNKAGESAVIISVSMYGNRLLTTLGFNISADKWSNDRQRVKHGASVNLKTESKSNEKRKTSYNDINNWLNSIENHFTQLEIELATLPEAQKELDLMAEFNSKFRASKSKMNKEVTFFDRLDEFLKEKSKLNDWANGTTEIFNALRNHLQAFKPDLSFDYLNEAGLTSFLDYLKSVPLQSGEVGMKNSTLKKHLSFLKWFLRWTIEKGYNTNNDFIDFKPKLKTAQKQIVFLEWDELIHVYNFKFDGDSAKRLEQVRDVFCFSCFTGLRYSDIANLKHNNITDDAITVTTLKTNDTLIIDLNDYSKAILQKYADKAYPFNKALPVISNQKMNQYLKEMAKECGLDALVTDIQFKGNERIETVQPKHELISTHTGRRTFISNALMKGISANVVMQFTGHSDYKAMKPYIAIAESAKKEAMKLFNM